MDETTSRRVCELIAGMIFADQQVHASEKTFFERMLTKFGLPPDSEVRPIADHGEAVATLRALPESARIETLDLLIGAAAADGTIAPEERMLLGAVADELRVDEEEVDDRLRKALGQ